MNDPTLHDKIEAFLTGQMAAGDAEAFRREMAADQRLASEVELQRLEHDAMNLLLEKDLQKKMAYWDDAPPPNTWFATWRGIQSSSARVMARLPTRICVCGEPGRSTMMTSRAVRVGASG